MFGSKLRSWMENHIGRPRKRGNKHKNNAGQNEVNSKKEQQQQNQQNGGVPVTNTNTLNGHYGTSNGGNSGNNITSPVRRREVSPIQNHSRYGWQSPDSENIISPKSDNFLYAPQQRVRSHQHQQQQQQQTSKIFENKPPNGNSYQHNYKKQQQQLAQNNSSSSFSSLSWSTGSKEQNVLSFNNGEQRGTQCLPQTPIITFHAPPPTTAATINDSSNYDEDDDNGDGVHYEEIQTILRQPNNLHANRHQTLQERPKSDQLSSFATPSSYGHRQHELINSKYAKDDAGAVRYGKLLPSRMQPNNASGSLLLLGSAESLPCNSHQMQNSAGDFNAAPWQNRTAVMGHNSKQHYPISNGTGTIPLHALSSPESAYSTGYSTDGHSPGAGHNHPPEYYINMRTGTHYFPKSVNSLAIEAQRYKFGLNKIEEMSPIEPLPNVSFATANHKMSNSSFYVSPKHSFPGVTSNDNQERRAVGCHSPLVLRNAIMLPTLHGFESSSPRQRCRIRTNPWYSTADTASSTGGMPSTTSSSSLGMPIKQTVSTSATSSTLSSSKSSASTFGQSNILTSSMKGRQSSSNSGGDMFNYASKDMYDSSSSVGTEDGKQHSTLSLTEVEASRQRASSGGGNSNNNNNSSSSTFRVKRASHNNKSGRLHVIAGGVFSSSGAAPTPPPAATPMAPVVSDEDATLNEMMGKFDESYVYEKETDILSDSDATNCPSELDTGLDAEDECDTDELLDIDFIDTSSMKEAHDRKEFCFNAWNGAAGYNFKTSYETTATTTTRMSRRSRHSQDLKAQDSSDGKQVVYRRSGSSGSHRRRKRLIKTRKKNTSECKENVMPPGSPLQQRSRETRSVGGTPISLRRNPTVSRERLKKISPMPVRASSLIFHHDQLMKADMEADVKYRQLIEEAESILVSLKSSTQTIPRETPVSSPRRINPLVNKRVEMLKSFEGRQIQQQQQSHTTRTADMETDINAALNKRIELLKHESSSVPNSPKIGAPRFSPSKTHLTNFINQIDGQPRKQPTSNEHQRISRNLNVPQQHQDGRLSRSPTPTSPLKMAAPQCGKQNANANALPPMSDFDSDFELENNENTKFLTYDAKAATRKQDLANHNCLPEITRVLLRAGAGDALRDDYVNHNTNVGGNINMDNNGGLAMPRFCPQSEPLKRKIYKGSSTFERLKFSFDLEASSHAGHSRVAAQPTLSNTSSQEFSFSQLSSFNKKQLLLDTLSDLKQNLENQSVELNGLNAN